MAHADASPSRWLTSFSALTRWALWLLLAAWLTLGLAWGALHFLIVPRIGDFRPWLEQQASKRLGVTVHMRDIVARSNGFIPSVELRDVLLFDANGRESLRLPSVLAALSPRSALGLGFEQLYIEGPELAVRRTADGRFWIAGFALPDGSSDSGAASEWVFSQTELVVRHGTVRWTDELRQQPTLALGDVDVVLRNKRQGHALRVDANPPAGWGSRLSVQAEFKQPLFFGRKGDWRSWVGQVYAEAPQLDLALLRNYVDVGVDLRQGSGSARAWLDVDRAKVTSVTTDLALQAVTVKVAQDLAPLELERVSGRLGFEVLDGGYALRSESLVFDTRDGLHWPGGNMQLSVWDAQTDIDARGTLQADRLNLAALGAIASRLPLDATLRETIERLAPSGQVQTLAADWQHAPDQPLRFHAKGHVQHLHLASQPREGLGVPGVRGADVVFDMTHTGGRATVAMKDGDISFPGVFGDPLVPFEALSSEVRWKQDGPRITVDVNKLRFANADAQGEAQFQWRTAEVPRGGAPDARFPGMLDLQGTFNRVNLAAVPRYLPLDMDLEARDYLAQALLAGEGSNARFKVKGNLDQFPFDTAKQGEFRIAGEFKNASYAYAPAYLMEPGSAPWPVLTQATGTLLLERDNLQIKSAKGLVVPGGGLQFSKADVVISKLYDAPVVAVTAEARGPLAEALAFVNQSPIGRWIDNAMASSTVTGVADYKLKLRIPVEQVEKSTAQGSVVLAGNDFQFAPAVPRLSRIRGQLAFSDTGFTVNGLQARALGGDVRLDGGMNFGAAVPLRLAPGSLRLQGVATAEGLRQAAELGLVARAAQFSTGSAAYNATVGLRAGHPELLVTSNLVGLALNLPEPLHKLAEGTLPLRLESTVVRASQQAGARLQDRWQVGLGRLAQVTVVRDIAGAVPQVLRGAIGVGLSAEESVPLPASGISANVNVAHADVDAWTAIAARLLDAAPGANMASLGNSADNSYLPDTLALRAGELWVQGRRFNQVVLGGARDGQTWRANVQATELGGYLEYRPSTAATPGRVLARLTHLALGTAAEQDVESLLDQQPASIPALDIVVDNMELRGKKLGRVEVQAVNLGASPARDAVREWRLNRFNITLPEATLAATGNWVNVNAQAAAPRSVRERRRTVLNFKLDVADSGDLLKRFGMPGVIAKGKGKVEGQVSWLGSPFSPDYASMGGGFNINMESGQFLKADPGIAKLLGVLSLQSLPRRLALDFRDVFSEGFSFDYVRGDATITQGIARTTNLQMKGVNAAVMMDGEADIAKESQRIRVVVVPEINVGSASLLYSAINPVVGLTTFLANLLLRGPLVNANTQEFLIDGTWLDPRVTQVTRTPDAPAAPASTP
jgi:uncharacterized protein (TIGR02099 family)